MPRPPSALGGRSSRFVSAACGWAFRTTASPSKRWTPRRVSAAGHPCPIRLLARKLRRTRIAVTAKRELLRIPNMIEGYHRWRPEDDAILGQRPDKYVALLLGISVESVKHRRHV